MEYKLSKIICTIGNKSCDEHTLLDMAKSGMSVARLNMSHGNYESHLEIIRNIRKIEKELSCVIAIALDTRGPELRIGNIKSGMRYVRKGDVIRFCNDYTRANEDIIYIPILHLGNLSKGDKIMVDDGNLELTILDVTDKIISMSASNDHTLQPNKRVSIPGACISAVFLSEKDRKDILFGIDNEVDFIFASFVSSRQDVITLNDLLKDLPNRPKIVSKIESTTGFENLREILDESDGIMIARGDLGVEIGLKKVFKAQKIISKVVCAEGKPLICATQMMESMTENSVPTRAEIMDVGNAILDGCDCVMLSAETASGKYPIETVKMMRDICLEAEEYTMNDEINKSHENFNILESGMTLRTIFIVTDKISDIETIRKWGVYIPIFVLSDDIHFLRKLQLMSKFIPIKVGYIGVETIIEDILSSFAVSDTRKDLIIRNLAKEEFSYK